MTNKGEQKVLYEIRSENQIIKDLLLNIQTDLSKCVNGCLEALQNIVIRTKYEDKLEWSLNSVINNFKITDHVKEMNMDLPLEG